MKAGFRSSRNSIAGGRQHSLGCNLSVWMQMFRAQQIPKRNTKISNRRTNMESDNRQMKASTSGEQESLLPAAAAAAAAAAL